jgi:hypothetical protein
VPAQQRSVTTNKICLRVYKICLRVDENLKEKSKRNNSIELRSNFVKVIQFLYHLEHLTTMAAIWTQMSSFIQILIIFGLTVHLATSESSFRNIEYFNKLHIRLH